MPSRTVTLLVLVPTVVALTACGVVRRHERREDRRDDRKDLVSQTAQGANLAIASAAAAPP